MSEEKSCRLCGSEVEPEEDFCFGCHSFICDKHWQSPWGNHNPKDHDSTGAEEDDE